MENIADEDMYLYYQVDYVLTEVPTDAAFHAQFRRVNRLPYKTDYTILLDGIQGKGSICGYLYGVWRTQQWLVGRRRNKILHGWRHTVPNDLWNRNRRLFLRLLRF